MSTVRLSGAKMTGGGLSLLTAFAGLVLPRVFAGFPITNFLAPGNCKTDIRRKDSS